MVAPKQMGTFSIAQKRRESMFRVVHVEWLFLRLTAPRYLYLIQEEGAGCGVAGAHRICGQGIRRNCRSKVASTYDKPSTKNKGFSLV
jgi:hypothetical protein